MEKHKHFPLFIETTGKKIVVVGSGKIGTRRIVTLCKFDFDIYVVAIETSETVRELAREGKITLEERAFQPKDIEAAFAVIATTNSRQTNQAIGEIGRRNGAYVSISDKGEECDFYFPAIAEDKEMVIGIVGDGTNHHRVAEKAKEIRNLTEKRK